MPLDGQEIVVGAVSYFDTNVLSGDAAVKGAPPAGLGMRQYVCIEHNDGRSTWARLTLSHKKERLCISQWRSGGGPRWNNEDVFLNDGNSTCVGPDSSFINAANMETPFNTIKRPSISEEGVAAILAEVIKREGLTLSSW